MGDTDLDLGFLCQPADEGKLRPTVSLTLSLDCAAEAHEASEGITCPAKSSSRPDVFYLPFRICFYDPATADLIRSAIFLSHWA